MSTDALSDVLKYMCISFSSIPPHSNVDICIMGFLI